MKKDNKNSEGVEGLVHVELLLEMIKSKYAGVLILISFNSFSNSTEFFKTAKLKGAYKFSDCQGFPFSKLYLNFPLLGNIETIKYTETDTRITL